MNTWGINKKKLFSLVRHILTFVAGLLVARGKLDPTEADSIVGGIMLLGGALWGYHKPEAQDDSQADEVKESGAKFRTGR